MISFIFSFASDWRYVKYFLRRFFYHTEIIMTPYPRTWLSSYEYYTTHIAVFDRVRSAQLHVHMLSRTEPFDIRRSIRLRNHKLKPLLMMGFINTGELSSQQDCKNPITGSTINYVFYSAHQAGSFGIQFPRNMITNGFVILPKSQLFCRGTSFA